MGARGELGQAAGGLAGRQSAGRVHRLQVRQGRRSGKEERAVQSMLSPLSGERAACCTAANDATQQSPCLPHCNARAGQCTLQHTILGFSSVRGLQSASGQSVCLPPAAPTLEQAPPIAP